MAKVTKVNHIGIAVEDIQEELVFWQEALGIELDHVETMPSQQSKVAFLPVGGAK